MFSENLKQLRKQKGLTQEELAARLHVVRQTISKWEQGLSVPDADLLLKLAEILEVSVTRLLGQAVEERMDQNELAQQLAGINEQLAVRNRRARRVWQAVIGAVITIVVINLLLIITGVITNYSYREQTEISQQKISEEIKK